MTTKEIIYNNSRIIYTVSGKGLPVMLVHGFAEDRRIWDDFAGRLSEEFLLIVPDLPGSGQSELLQGDGVQISDYAALLYAILQKENIAKCCMIGHSMGGYISLSFAEKYPGMLCGLGLFHSSAYADDEAKKDTRRKGIEFIQNNGPLAFLKTSIPGLFADAEKSKADITELIGQAEAFSAEALIQYYNAMIARPDTTVVLQNTRTPVLFIMGVHDKAVPFQHSLEQSHLPSIAHIHILRNGAHMGMLEEKEASFTDLRNFLQSVHVL
ncbi:MAG: alpha/beta hydrolase [Ferruginibacter sp.]